MENTPRSVTFAVQPFPHNQSLVTGSDWSLISSALGQCVGEQLHLTHTHKIVQAKLNDSIGWGVEKESHRLLLLTHNQCMVHKMFTNIFLFFTLSNHSFIPPFKPLWIKAALSLALCQLNSITITILGPGRWMGDEARREAKKNGWHSHWNQENSQLNCKISNLMHLNQIQ